MEKDDKRELFSLFSSTSFEVEFISTRIAKYLEDVIAKAREIPEIHAKKHIAKYSAFWPADLRIQQKKMIGRWPYFLVGIDGGKDDTT